MTANPTTVGLNQSSTITVTGFKPDGNPLNPGSQVNLTTDLGTLDLSVLTIGDNGRASTVLRPDGRSGTATVTATLPVGEATATATVQIGESAETKPTLSIVVTPSTLALGETATVEVQARNADGSLLGSGGQVRLRTSLGQLDETNLVTDSNGEASTVFRAGDDPGTATITGSVNSSDEVTVDVSVENQQPILIIEVNPQIVNIGESADVTVFARDNNNVPLGRGHEVFFTASLGRIDESVKTDRDGIAKATYVADSRVADVATITALLGSSDPVTADITIRDVANSISLTAQPPRVDAGGNDGPMQTPTSLVAVVRNSQGEPFAGGAVTFQAVIFNSQVGIGTLASGGGTVLTNAQGEAVDTLRLRADELADPDTGELRIECIQVFAEIGGPDNQLLRDEARISVGNAQCPAN